MRVRDILLARCFNVPGVLLLSYAVEFTRLGDWGFAAAFVLMAALVSTFGGRWAEAR